MKDRAELRYSPKLENSRRSAPPGFERVAPFGPSSTPLECFEWRSVAQREAPRQRRLGRRPNDSPGEFPERIDKALKRLGIPRAGVPEFLQRSDFDPKISPLVRMRPVDLHVVDPAGSESIFVGTNAIVQVERLMLFATCADPAESSTNEPLPAPTSAP